MTQTAKAQEPSMEEILASIRRIIADDDSGKPSEVPGPKPVTESAARPAAPRPAPAPSAPPPQPAPAAAPAKAMNQDDIDAMLASFDASPEAVDEPSKESAEADILDLTESMATAEPGPSPAPEQPKFRTIDADSDVIFSDPAPESRPETPQSRPSAPQLEPESPLLSAATSSAVDSAFNSLAHTVLMQNSRTLEDLVREMLRPMLKSWLDDNLPGLVERLVRAEIDRVSRGRG